jgi:hypothetical protein
MNSRVTDELARWVAAEQADAWDEADARFAAMASVHLPRLLEPAGLAARVMAALPRTSNVLGFRVVLDAAGWWWVRATVAAAVTVLGAALAGVSLGQFLAFSTRSVEALARLAAGLFTSGSAVLGVVAAAWGVLIDLGRAAMVLVTSGPAPALIGANVLLACLAFAGLSRLLSPQEECL